MAHRQRVGLRVQIGAALELARVLLGVERLAEGIDGLVEVRRGHVGAEGVDRPYGEGMRLAGRDEAARGAVTIARLAAILLEDDTAEGKAGSDIVTKDRALLEVLVGLLDLRVGDQFFEELRRARQRTPVMNSPRRLSSMCARVSTHF